MGVRNTSVAEVRYNNSDNLRTVIHELRRVKNAIAGSSGGGSATLAEQQSQTTLLSSIDMSLNAIESDINNLISGTTLFHDGLVNPSSVTYTNFKKISFACDGTINVTINGNTMTYPFTLGVDSILGAEYECSSITSDVVEFDGTGTVLITLIS